MAKLTDQQVLEILDRVRLGEKQHVVAVDFNITQVHVSHLVNGRRRKKVTAP